MSGAISFLMVFLLGNTAMMNTEVYIPTLRLEPEETVYIVGESLSLRCVADMPTSVSGFSFFKDAAVIANNSVSNRLTIPSLSTMDSGNYICTYYQETTGTQQESNFIDLKVFERPTAPILTVEPKKNVFVVNESVVIRCNLPRGQSATGVSLYQDERILSEADDFGVLSLAKTERRHTGKYTCDYETVISGRTLTSHVSNQETLVVIDLPPTPILRYANNQKQTGQVEIVCEIPNPPSSFLIQGYRLYRNGGEISSNKANQFVINYHLEFDGCYFCRSFVNVLGEEILSHKSAEVFLPIEGSNTKSCQNPNSKTLKPTLRLEPEKTVYIVGESLSMRCVADTPTSISGYSFFKDTTLIANNSVSNRLNKPSLFKTDAGNYFCTYYQETTGTQQESNYIDLKVFERPASPILVVEPKRNVFVVNESLVIRCLLPRGQSAEGIALYQDGRILYEADNFGVLSLANTERRHTGMYSCDYKTVISGRTLTSHVSNQETLLVIDLPPTPILRYAKNLQNQNSQVEIVCEIPNPPFSSLIDGYHLYRNGGEISSNQANQFVINYNLEFDGCYFCRSFVNVLGEEILSLKSVEVFLTLEGSNTRSCLMQNSENGHGL
ncbi:immunoglobulin superfamily member 1-like isoform X1 [Bufo gargarizans]|uniref:immunoglobulin superfamily member 1-like isoform X1 n=1 Tax=Bufo gargarizans TaxID=30331 RepID=UPI001CF5EAD7|nr:immunoglobulin superfamily member 1-like isoform X1 [Bufo gargarizans]XP_044130731.1 immunoglobulin superfamily member 1-like isoform X1 [Bufo gargarizans]